MRGRQPRRRGRIGRWGVGLVAGALLALGLTPLAAAPRAHADFDDILDPIIDAIAQSVAAVDPSPTLTLDSGLDLSSIMAPALAADATSALAAEDLPENAIPLTMTAVTEPIINLSISGGSELPILLDTGSNGLVVPWYQIGLDNLTFPTSFGIGAYSGGLQYFYVTLPEQTVDFGHGIVSGPTSIDVELFAWPTTLQGWFLYPSFEAFLRPAEAVGVLGIASDAVGPDDGPTTVISALPGDLSQGVLINEPGGYVQFGPDPLSGGVTVDGIANAVLNVQVGNGDKTLVNTIIDSGGVYGTIPQGALDQGGTIGQTLAPDQLINVFTKDGQTLLYSYTTTATNSPTIVPDRQFMNTGFMPFNLGPIYIGYDPATTTFHSLPT